MQVKVKLPLHMQYLCWASALLLPSKSFVIQEGAANFVDAHDGLSVSDATPRMIENDSNFNPPRNED